MSHHSISYRPDIDGLRAIAILSVVGYHTFPNLIPGGFVGVDIFFVISGFLISSIILKGLNSSTFSFSKFYARRVKRIFPALIVVMATCLVFGWFVLLPDEYAQLGKSVLGGAGFAANLVLIRDSGYYFSETSGATSPLLHLWSLGVEEQFYFVWPLLIWAIFKLGLRFIPSIAGIAIASFVICLLWVGTDSSLAFYSPISRFWELSLGGVLAYLGMNARSGDKPWVANNVKAICGVTLLVSSLACVRSDGFPGWLALLPAIGSVLLISAGKDTWFNKVVLSNKVVVWVGAISYPLSVLSGDASLNA
jgi:peptidoglycan/LPS O-acetylase OafA/YrhL